MAKLIIIGSGGHAGVVINAIEELGYEGFDIDGLLDDFSEAETMKHGYEVLGPISSLVQWVTKFNTFGVFIAIGDSHFRYGLVSRFRDSKLIFPAIVHPSAAIANEQIGKGTFIGPGAVIGPGSEVGAFSIVNTHASLDHDSKLGDFSHLAPGVVTGGHVTIGSNTLIGIGAMIRDRVTIGNNCVIGAGSVVVKDVPDNSFGYGNPWKYQDIK